MILQRVYRGSVRVIKARAVACAGGEDALAAFTTLVARVFGSTTLWPSTGNYFVILF